MISTKDCLLIALLFLLFPYTDSTCNQCYSTKDNENCKEDPYGINSYTLHMSVHPHLDAFWIFDFESYYDPKPNQGSVHSYFSQNRFHSVKQIFNTASEVLEDSRKMREQGKGSSQKAHRSFFNSEMGFFKRWYFEQSEEKKKIVKGLLKTKYWEIVGGGFVEHDQGCAYYDDIIENYQMGLRFLKEQFGYRPRAAISADSFGHSSSTLAILAHIGVEGYFVQRSDEHILLQNKTQFVWKAKSANGKYYGALPTHVRWAIHGFEDQFVSGVSDSREVCKTKSNFINNMKRENEFLKRILKSNHIMRYFGHDFQQFDAQAYNVIEGMMDSFARQKCQKVTAQYGNPTEYFMTLMGEVFGKVKKPATRTEDIFPIWDYDSGLYWTGYYTTDPYHKKNYRDVGRFLHAVRKGFLPIYMNAPDTQQHKNQYKLLDELAETVTYLQHHDGISGTSKYEVMDKYEILAEGQVKKVKEIILAQIFEKEYADNCNKPITTMQCSLENECTVPANVQGDIYLKIFNSAGTINHEPIVVHLRQGEYFEPDCEYYEINCFCTSYPCPCSLYLFPKLGTYSTIRLKKVDKRPKDANLMRELYSINSGKQVDDNAIKYNETHFTIIYNNKEYSIGYKRLDGEATRRSYDHLSRYGDQIHRSFNIRSGKYALGNNIKTQKNLSKIRKILRLESDYLKKYVIIWAREQMKTVITITNQKTNQFKIETHSSAQTPKLEDIYLQISAPHIQNEKTFYTDSNGWLVMKRQLFKHEDYEAFFSPEGFDDIDGNSYPMTAFSYIKNQKTGSDKLSVNTDRPQGVVAYHPGTLWMNIDRLSSDDGKWVYETTFKSQYQKFTHYITVQNDDFNERRIQKLYDSPLLIQPNDIDPSIAVAKDTSEQMQERTKWINASGLNKIKFTVKPWNDTTVTLRVQNMHENLNQKVQLYTADNMSPLLTAFYGNMIHFDSIQEMALGGNINYKEFVDTKWNWKDIIDLSQENQIFNKILSETISLRPLEIRTFQLRGVKVIEQCKKLQELSYDNQEYKYELDLSKPMPRRKNTENQKNIIEYMLNGDHCSQNTPVLEVTGQSKKEEADEDHQIINNNVVQKPQEVKKTTEIRKEQSHQNTKTPNIPQNKPYIQHSDNEKKTLPEKSHINKPQSVQPKNPPSDSLTLIRRKIMRMETLTRQQKIEYFGDKIDRIIEKLTE